MRLDPEGLGAMQATVVADPQHVSVSLVVESDSARQIVEQSLPTLAHHLGQGGAEVSVTVTVRQDGMAGDSSGNGRHHFGDAPSAPGATGDQPDTPDPTLSGPPGRRPPAVAASRLIDIQL